MKTTALILLLYALALMVLPAEESRKVGEWFVVGAPKGGSMLPDGISPDGKLAVVVGTDEKVGIPNPKGGKGGGVPVRLVDTQTAKVLWEDIVDGDFSWGPLPSMITARWNTTLPSWKGASNGFVLRVNQGRMMSATRLILRSESGEWGDARHKPSDFEESAFYQNAYEAARKSGEEWFEKMNPPNHPPPGFRHFGSWIPGRKILVHESCIGDLIYRFDMEGNLLLVGFDGSIAPPER